MYSRSCDIMCSICGNVYALCVCIRVCVRTYVSVCIVFLNRGVRVVVSCSMHARMHARIHEHRYSIYYWTFTTHSISQGADALEQERSGSPLCTQLLGNEPQLTCNKPLITS